MVVVEAPPNKAPSDETAAGTEAGAIRDAKLRRARRRKRRAALLAGLAALGLLGAWLATRGGSDSRSPSGAHARVLALGRANRLSRPGEWRISPALGGGSYGWCIHEQGGGSCATVPVQTSAGRRGASAVSVGTLAGSTGAGREERLTALLSANVHAVLVRGRPVPVLARAALPYDLRLAQIVLVKPRYGAPTPPLLAIGADGRPLGFLREQSLGAVSKIRWWQKPAQGAAGPCQIRARGVPGLEPEWGHVAAALTPYPAKIIGRSFFSCADTEYYLRKWPLESAILLDAQHPGSAPAAIPRMTPVAGAPGLFNAPGGFDGELTAERRAHTWLVVAGGSGLAQRIEVLRHLTTSVAWG